MENYQIPKGVLMLSGGIDKQQPGWNGLNNQR